MKQILFNYVFERWYFRNNFKQAKEYLLEVLDYFLSGDITYNTTHGTGFVKRPDPEPHSLGSTINEKRKKLKHLIDGFGTGSLPAKDLYFHFDLYRDGKVFYTAADSLEESHFVIDSQVFSKLKQYLVQKKLPTDLIHSVDATICRPINRGLGKWLKATRCYSPKKYRTLKQSKS